MHSRKPDTVSTALLWVVRSAFGQPADLGSVPHLPEGAAGRSWLGAAYGWVHSIDEEEYATDLVWLRGWTPLLLVALLTPESVRSRC